jgi:hypothetical protein
VTLLAMLAGGAMCWLLMPAAAWAAPLSSQITATQAQQARAQTMVAQMHADLMAQMSQYTALCVALGKAQQEVSRNATDLARLDSSLATIQAQLDDRATLLYQSGGDHVIELFLASSVQDFLLRAEYLVELGENDSDLVADVASTRAQSQRLHTYLKARQVDLAAQQQRADEQIARILARLKANEIQAKAAGADLANLLAQQKAQTATSGGASVGQQTPAGAFNENMIVSDANYYAAGSMNVADIQGFLNAQKGPLKTYATPDHNGTVKTAAHIIDDAAKAWGVSPRTILVTLQKEQSLLSEPSPAQKALDWALGMGATDSGKVYKYQGFGKQVWFGASHLSSLGNGWSPGLSTPIDGTRVVPSNRATWGLYRYTPHFAGNTSFWMVWWRYFGDPLS